MWKKRLMALILAFSLAVLPVSGMSAEEELLQPAESPETVETETAPETEAPVEEETAA